MNTKNDAAQTLHGTYIMQTMPDGQQVMMSKLSNGEWVTTAERLRRESEQEKQKEFENRFIGTATIPDDFKAIDTDTLIPNETKVGTVTGSHNRLEAYLTEMLGNPDDILAGIVEVKQIKESRIKEHICGLIKVFNSPKWNLVKEKIWK